MRDYPRVTIRLPPQTVKVLKALARARQVPIWRLVDELICEQGGKGRIERENRKYAQPTRP